MIGHYQNFKDYLENNVNLINGLNIFQSSKKKHAIYYLWWEKGLSEVGFEPTPSIEDQNTQIYFEQTSYHLSLAP